MTTSNDDDRTDLEKAFDHVSDTFNNFVQGQSLPADPRQVSAFFRAVRRANVEDLQQILDAGFDPDTFNNAGETALHIAARNNFVEIAGLLVARGAHPQLGKKDSPQDTPLQSAVSFGKLGMIEFLAQHGGYQPGSMSDGRTLLHRACEKGNVQVVAALLRAGADVNEMTETGVTPLLIAVQRSQADVIEALLEIPAAAQGMNIHHNKLDHYKRNAFQLAVDHGRAAIVARMISKGALVNVPDAEGITPIENALTQGNIEMVRVLAEGGADLNKCATGLTPLMLVCAELRTAAAPQLVDELVRLGADTTPAGCATPLQAAVMNNHIGAVTALLKYPVSAEAHKQALAAAREKKYPEMVSLLETVLPQKASPGQKPELRP